MKVICQLLFLLLCCSCSGGDKNTQPAPKKTTHEEEIQPVMPEPDTLKVHTGKYRVTPLDQSKEDNSLQAFILELKKNIKQRDLNGLVACLDTGIVVSWGGGEYGIEAFKVNYGLNSIPEKSDIWKNLQDLIAMGGAWDNKEKTRFCYPYLNSNLLYGRLTKDLDCYNTVTCIEPNVIVYEKANIQSKKIGILSYEILTVTNYSGSFSKIHTIDNTISGYVLTKQLLHCAAAYPIIEKIDGTWKITSYAPYD